MDGIDQLHILIAIGNSPQGSHDVGHGLTVIFPPMAGNQNDLLPLIIQMVEKIGGKFKKEGV